ncbi:MAG: hypothetical protein Q9187_005242 [Circinaria calcarea]
MNVRSQSLRSPVSPYEQHAKQSFPAQRPCYPTSAHSESLAAGNGPGRGLGLYPGSLAPSQACELASSPHTVDNWSHMHHEYSQAPQPPDIFSAAFDPFSGFASAPNNGMINVSSPEAPALDFCQTPPNSNLQSHRTSVSSSYTGSDDYSQSGSEYAYTPKVKTEEAGEWYPSAGNDHILQRNLSSQGPLVYTPALPSSQAEDVYRSQPVEWLKPDATGYIAELHPSPDSRLQRFDVQPILPSVTRTKKKRQRTTPEEATHECKVCGKLFKRSYNWKSHMETHNPERKYPHPCTAMVGNTQCTKRFQRKTDLDRHVDSVHLKARNHKCPLCGNRFARRDTLRRHTEDGCPKRFELGVREACEGSSIGSMANTSGPRWSFNSFPSHANRPRAYSVGVSMPQTSSMAPPLSATSHATFPPYNRGADYRGTAPISSPAYPS